MIRTQKNKDNGKKSAIHDLTSAVHSVIRGRAASKRGQQSSSSFSGKKNETTVDTRSTSKLSKEGKGSRGKKKSNAAVGNKANPNPHSKPCPTTSRTPSTQRFQSDRPRRHHHGKSSVGRLVSKVSNRVYDDHLINHSVPTLFPTLNNVDRSIYCPTRDLVPSSGWEDPPSTVAPFPFDERLIDESKKGRSPVLPPSEGVLALHLETELDHPIDDKQAQSLPHPSKSKSLVPQARPVSSSATIHALHTSESHGKKVTMIDYATKVFVIDMLSEDQCDHIRSLTDKHVKAVEARGGKAWRLLYTYTNMDLPCGEVDGLAPMMGAITWHVSIIIGDICEQPEAASLLCPRSKKEPHLLKYQKLPGEVEHTGIRMHYDGSHFTWNLMLSDPSEYSGGGTYIRCLRKTIKLAKGQVLVHPGDLFHQGIDISQGTRELVVCFMDGFDPCIKDESSKDEDCEEFQQNIIQF